MNIRDSLHWGREALSSSPTPKEDARLLLQHVLQVPRAHLVAHGDSLLTTAQEEAFRALVGRARRQEPIPYLIGEAPFYSRDFFVSPAVLIPRPETELLVEAALAWAREQGVRRVVDAGTGSGCIAITVALELPGVTVTASELSSAALAMARRNVARHGVQERVNLIQGSLLEPLAGPLSLVVANLPYISDEEWTSLSVAVKWYEPSGALRGGPGGLVLIRSLLQQADNKLSTGGAVFLEIGWQQKQAVCETIQQIMPGATVRVMADYAGNDRIVVVEK